MSRTSGIMLAIPLGFIPEPILNLGEKASPEDLVGPSAVIAVLAILEEEDGTETPAGFELEAVGGLPQVSDGHVERLRA